MEYSILLICIKYVPHIYFIFNVSSSSYLVGWYVSREGTQGRAHHTQALTTKLHYRVLTIKGNFPLLCHLYFPN